MIYSVYKITNTTNGKSYVGITCRSVEVRWSEHCSRARQGQRNSRLYDAIRKYGKDNFDVILLDTSSTDEEIRRLESQYIEDLDTFNSGYNCNLGGCGWLEVPDDVRRKIGEKSRRRTHTPESRQKMSRSRKGNYYSRQNLKEYINKGQLSPNAKWYLIQDPEDNILIGQGLRAFCRDYGLQHSKMSARKGTKGYKLLGTFNDYPEREYAQASGSATHPTG